MTKRFLVGLLLLTLALSASDADAQGLFKRLGLRKDSGLDTKTITSGLRDALKVGIDRTVKSVGKDDGYLLNDDIKISIPKSFRFVETPLRIAGYGDDVDEFILSMNRAAEAAAPLAKEIFIEAIASMSINDAKGILNGSDTAATEYLSKTTREKLLKAFTPKIHETMNQFGVTRKYQAVVGQYDSLPFTRNLSQGNIEEYTTNKALDGLFLMLGQEEKRIRTQPAARTTDLLRKVFES